MRDKILTITVPSYNAQKYLKKCLDSFKQDEIIDDIEIIIVNDGSTDATAEIAETYVGEYPDTYKLINKENGGHGSGINAGIQNATGKYFKVVDADDWVNETEFVGFVKMLRDIDSDIVSSDFLCIEDETYKELRHIPATDDEARYGHEYDMSEVKLDRVVKMHNLTVKTGILKGHYRPIDEHCFYVDEEYITYPIPYVNTIYFDKRSLYMYRLGRAGQSMNWDSMARNKDMHLKVLSQLIKFYDEVSPEMSGYKLEYLERCIGDMIDNQFQIFIILGNKAGIRTEIKQWDESLKTNYPRLYNATSKKSIDLIRKTNYMILPIAKLAHKIVKG